MAPKRVTVNVKALRLPPPMLWSHREAGGSARRVTWIDRKSVV